MTYDISNGKAPKMPNLGKGLETLKLILSQVSQEMREAIVPTLFPSLGALVSNTVFQYADHTWKEPCGLMNHLIGVTGIGKGQMDSCSIAITRDLVEHDDAEIRKLIESKREANSGADGNKKKKKEKTPPVEICLFAPPSDVTNPAFLQNAMACMAAGNKVQYYRMPEIEMADSMCGGHKKFSPTIRNIFDCQFDGALRASLEGVTGKPKLRVCINFASTPIAARRYYKYELFNGTLGRINFSYKAREERSGKIPRLGTFDDDFLAKLDVYLERLKECNGRYKVPQLNKLADKLAADMARLADLTDDDNLWDIAKRSIIYAWKSGCILYILNNMVWTRAIGELVEWMVYYDLWSKMQVFGDMFDSGDNGTSEVGKKNPKNMLDLLPDSFSETQLETLRTSLGKSSDAKNLLRVWTCRKYIEYSAQTGLYTKTEVYINRNK